MATIRFGLVGLGMGHSRAVQIAQTEGARLVAVADLQEERLQRTAAATGCETTRRYEELLERKDIDVIMVMTPSGMHAEMGIQAAEAGKHVITTKPMDIAVEKATALIEACHKANVLLAIDFEARFFDGNVQVRQAIDQGLLGKLIFGEVSLKWWRAQSYYDDGWHGTWKWDGGGALMNQTVHDIDLLLWFMGEPRRVIGCCRTFAHKMETEDFGMAMIEFENGAVGRILGTTTFPRDLPNRTEIHGDKLGVTLLGHQLRSWHPAEGNEAPNLSFSGPRNTIEDVIEALTEQCPPRVPGEEGIKSLRLIRAIYESSRNGGRPVDV